MSALTVHSNGAAALTAPDLEERRQLLANVIMRNGTPAQVDLVMHLCSRYGLDPLLKHIVLINGAPYVTRDGLLHIAHASGKFDGIEVELTQARDGEWAATCTVWRKGSDRPIRYTAYQKEHQPANVGASAWKQYPRAMLQKCAEVMTLRRAFDVSLGAVEELGYDGQQPQSSIGQVVTIERPQLIAPIEHDPDDDLPEYEEAFTGMHEADFQALFAKLATEFENGTERPYILEELRKNKALMTDEQFARGQAWWKAFKALDQDGMAAALAAPAAPAAPSFAGAAG